MVYHSKRWTLGLDIIIGAIILGPILALLIEDDEERIIKQKRKKEKERNDRHIGWFRTMGEINKQRTPTWFRTIPPPPPISPPPNRRPDIKKDFKFFRG
jgi:hypothetical protein